MRYLNWLLFIGVLFHISDFGSLAPLENSLIENSTILYTNERIALKYDLEKIFGFNFKINNYNREGTVDSNLTIIEPEKKSIMIFAEIANESNLTVTLKIGNEIRNYSYTIKDSTFLPERIKLRISSSKLTSDLLNYESKIIKFFTHHLENGDKTMKITSIKPEGKNEWSIEIGCGSFGPKVREFFKKFTDDKNDAEVNKIFIEKTDLILRDLATYSKTNPEKSKFSNYYTNYSFNIQIDTKSTATKPFSTNYIYYLVFLYFFILSFD